MCKDRPKAGNVSVGGHEEQIRVSGNGLKEGAVAGNEPSRCNGVRLMRLGCNIVKFST
jgi:hypothetical protein